ncbi:MAG: hypothetical protein ACXWLB_03915 [Reyranella sp.]
MTAIALAAATWIGPPAPSAVGEEPSTDSELLVAYCVGVFGADPGPSFRAPACLANERTDDCLVRIADIGQERQRVDHTLRRLQDSLATRGIVARDRYMALAKYLVATSCWEGL